MPFVIDYKHHIPASGMGRNHHIKGADGITTDF